MQLFSQLQSFIYFDNTRGISSQLSNSYDSDYDNDLRLIIVEDSKMLENNSSEGPNQNHTMSENQISLMNENAMATETTLLDSNKLAKKIDEPMLIKDSLHKCHECSRVCLNKLGLLNHTRIMHSSIKKNKTLKAKHSHKTYGRRLKSLASRKKRV